MKIARVIFNTEAFIEYEGKRYLLVEDWQELETNSYKNGKNKPEWEERFFELKEKGLTHRECAEILTTEGYQDKAGNPVAVTTILSRLSNMKRAERVRKQKKGAS